MADGNFLVHGDAYVNIGGCNPAGANQGSGSIETLGHGGIIGIFNNHPRSSNKYLKIGRINARPLPVPVAVSPSNSPTPGRFLLSRISAHEQGYADWFDVIKMNPDADDLPAEVSILGLSKVTQVSTISRRAGRLGFLSQTSTNLLSPTMAYFLERAGANRHLVNSIGIDDAPGIGIQKINCAEGQGFAVVCGSDSQNLFPYPKSYNLRVNVIVTETGQTYSFSGHATTHPGADFALFSIMNGAGSGVTLRIAGVWVQDNGAFEDINNGPIGNNKQWVCYTKVNALSGGEDITPVSLTGEELPADFLIRRGTMWNELTFSPVLFQDVFKATGQFSDSAGVTGGNSHYQGSFNTGKVGLTVISSDDTNIKHAVGSIRRTASVGGMAPDGTAASGKVMPWAWEKTPGQIGINADGQDRGTITLAPQEGLVIQNPSTYCAWTHYVFNAEFQYFDPAVPDNTYTRARLVNALA